MKNLLLAFLIFGICLDRSNANEIVSDAEDKGYHISCVSSVENAAVFTAPDTNKIYRGPGKKEVIKFRKGTDLRVDSLVEENGLQFLSGQILYYAQGGLVSTWERTAGEYSSEKDKDRLYVLSKDWDCRLYKNNSETSCSSDAIAAAYGELQKKYQNKCLR